ncbi:5-oxoprolinase subunit C family protein [Litchfieldia salsa]|uniref:Antagonist of KipI n=1 Tax=Litchfieldia salsa TaxID=930152 RepID=A0A1H0U5R5_9BACI|nr:biotin-dependent carboxyltransferase family protein [Litchfieldia salsa]SDP61410.1 antagonist of KipI [Litchfieldia salsa]
MIKIIKPGLFTTLQDLGRVGYQKYGVITSGAMDPFAHRMANILVGNSESEATLECTMVGPKIQFEQDTLFALCGGEFAAEIDGHPIKLWRPILVKAGSILTVGPQKLGSRVYLAVAGGYKLESVMGSKSTYIRAGIGGFKGRALLAGDTIITGMMHKLSEAIMLDLSKRFESMPFVQTTWSISTKMMPNYRKDPYIRVMKGRQFHLFTEESCEKLFTSGFKISNQSDRMGYRLEGPSLKVEKNEELLSEAVSFGTIQVPSDGQPIILLADRQTTGGYPKIAQVAIVDLPLLAQAGPNEKVEFIEVEHGTAERLHIERERMITQVKQAIFLKAKMEGRE